MIHLKSFIRSGYPFLAAFVMYVSLTLAIFWPRIGVISTSYGMPDVDTDGTLWYYWARIFSGKNYVPFDLNNLVGYPYGYDVSYIPFVSLVYELNILLMRVMGSDWRAIVFVSNLSYLVAYPLAAMSSYLLSYYFLRRHYPSFVAGLIFSFSYYHILQGRGSLSLNHIEFIPIYLLSLFYYLEKRNMRSLMISGLVFGIESLSNLYWGFFSSIFAIIIFLVYGFLDPKYSFRKNVSDFVKYFSVVICLGLLITTPALINQFYVFQPTLAAQLGRVINPQSQLVQLIGFFAPSRMSLLYPWGGEESMWGGAYDYFLGYASLAMGSFSVLAMPKVARLRRLTITLVCCFIFTLILASGIPGFEWANAVYFELFGYFRAINRLVIFASLFLGLLSSIFIERLFANMGGSRGRKTILFGLFIVLSIWAIAEGINTNPTWSKTTSFATLSQLYAPLKENAVGAVIAYPFYLSNGKNGFPANYLLLGQIIFERPIANGLDPQNARAFSFAENITLPSNNAIRILREYGIGTIIVYTNLVDNTTLNALKTNAELTYLGHFNAPPDKGYLSTNDLSRSIDVFIVKSMQNNITAASEVTSIGADIQSVARPTPFIRIVSFSNITGPFTLHFRQPYSEKWKLYVWNGVMPSVILPMLAAPVSNNTHGTFDGWANSWLITPNEIGCQDIKQHPGCSGKVVIYFIPGLMDGLAWLVSTTTISLIIVAILRLNSKRPQRQVTERKSQS